jgi:hypothetical protein
MVTVLYPRFLDDEQQYTASERFWAHLFDSVVAESGNKADWVRWRARAYANGLPFERDGNPIFDARSIQLPKAVQIIQWPPETTEIEISAWMSELVVSSKDEPATVHELTINCSLSVESAKIAKELLQSWVTETVNVHDMGRLIDFLIRSDAG